MVSVIHLAGVLFSNNNCDNIYYLDVKLLDIYIYIYISIVHKGLHGFILSKYLNDILYLVNVNIKYLEYDLIILIEYWYPQYSGYNEVYKQVKRFIYMIFVILSSG